MSEAGISYYKKGAIVSYITIAVNIIASLLYTPWMLSKIGNSNYGLYTLATTLINMFLLDFGFSSAVSRFVAKYNAEGNQEKIDNFLGMLYKLYAIIVGVVLLVLTVLFFFTVDLSTNDESFNCLDNAIFLLALSPNAFVVFTLPLRRSSFLI